MLGDAEFQSLKVEHLDGGQAPARPCFEVCLFYNQRRAELRVGLAKLFEVFVDRSEGRYAWLKTNTMKSFVIAKAPAPEVLSNLVASPEFGKLGNVGIELHSGATAADVRTPSIKFFSVERMDEQGKPVHRSAVRLCAPPSARDEGRDLFDIATACARAIPPYCGHAGYSWYWDAGDTRMERALAQRKGLLLKHPAMGYHDPFAFHPFIGQGLIQVGWLTFVGAELLKRLGQPALPNGGSNDLVRQVDLGKQCGAVFVAGVKPITGSRDPTRSSELEPYRAIGHRLAKLRLPDSALDFMDLAGFDDESDTRGWYLRFFGEE